MGLFGRSWSGEHRPEQTAAQRADGLAAPSDTDNRVPMIDDTMIDPEVHRHLERLAMAAEGEVGILTPEEFDSALTARLVGTERIRETESGFDHANWFADGVHEVLSLDLPSAVVVLPDSRLTETGHRLPSLLERGRQNLTTLAVTSPVDLERVGDGGGSVWAMIGDSSYTASFARFLDLMVRRLLPDADPGGGFVFAMPYRHAILVQPCSTPRETRDAIELMPPYAQALHADGAGPVSPHTYHWLDRRITCLTEVQPDGSLEVATTPLLDHVLGSGRDAG
jgi:hypothetical protein